MYKYFSNFYSCFFFFFPVMKVLLWRIHHLCQGIHLYEVIHSSYFINNIGSAKKLFFLKMLKKKTILLINNGK